MKYIYVYFTEQLLKHRELLEEKESELDSLKKKLKSRELELSNVREEEAQRAQVLQMAIMSYMNKAPPTGHWHK